MISTQPDRFHALTSTRFKRSLGAVICVAALSGCHTLAHGNRQTIRIDTNPSGAQGTFVGQTFTTPAIIRTHRRHDVGVIRVEKRGFLPRCQVVEAANRDGTRILTVLDSVPVPIFLAFDAMIGSLGGTFPDPVTLTLEAVPEKYDASEPLPSDEELIAAWSSRHRDLCQQRAEDEDESYTSPEDVARATRNDYARVIVTTGPISQQYDLLGNVHADTRGLVNIGAALNDALFRSRLATAIQATPHANNEQMNQLLRQRGLAVYGSRLSAIINVSYRVEPDGQVSADGLAVHFPDSEPRPVSSPGQERASERSLEERLKSLQSLYDQGLIGKDEYKARRARIIGGP